MSVVGLLRGLKKRAEFDGACAVHKDIDPTAEGSSEGCVSGGGQYSDTVESGEVGTDCFCLAAGATNLFDNRVGARCASSVIDNNRGAVLSQADCCRSAHPSGGAGDKGELVFERLVHLNIFLTGFWISTAICRSSGDRCEPRGADVDSGLVTGRSGATRL